MRTMRAWVSCFGKPLLCVIESNNVLTATVFRTDDDEGELLSGADLVVDGFDNHEARALVTAHCEAAGLPCLHVGLGAGYAEVRWNEGYRVPSDVVEEGADVCDYPMARDLIQFAVALASEAIVRSALEGVRQD